jgi:hypothetical protein
MSSGATSTTTTVGLAISGLSGATVWGIQVGNYQSYHQGKLAVGGTTAPANTIDIQAGVLNHKVNALTYASPTSVDITLGNVHTVTTVNATGSVTFNATSGGTAGQIIWIRITNDATSGKTITFGTNFKPTATLVGTTSKTATISFISDGTSWWEHGRSTGM